MGKKIGRHHWPESNKTIEGTVAFILSVIAFFQFCSLFNIVSITKTVMVGVVFTSIVSGK